MSKHAEGKRRAVVDLPFAMNACAEAWRRACWRGRHLDRRALLNRAAKLAEGSAPYRRDIEENAARERRTVEGGIISASKRKSKHQITKLRLR